MTKRQYFVYLGVIWALFAGLYLFCWLGHSPHLRVDAIINSTAGLVFGAILTLEYRKEWRQRKTAEAGAQRAENVSAPKDATKEALTEFLVQYVSYCALAEVFQNATSPVAKRNSSDMLVIALEKLWRAHRVCIEKGISIKELRAAMKEAVPGYERIALF
jgi:hypothetical protein